MFVVQDDTCFIAVVDLKREHVGAIALPPVNGRRRFEKALGNKLDKLDLESCLYTDGELLAFGSGSIAGVRDRICRVRGKSVELVDARALYDAIRDAVGGATNVEGVAHVGEELWMFHRGNCGPRDRPAIVRVDFSTVFGSPTIRGVTPCDLGDVDGVAFGFTDAATLDGRVFVACAAEASPDAIEDGATVGSRIGVVDGDVIRCAALDQITKIEGLVLDRDRTWITIDPDDVDVPAPLCEVDLAGPW